MKALIIYDDLTCAVNTSAVLHRAAHQADVSVKWDIRPWPLNVLELSPTADLALSDAISAHLIVFAIRRAPSLPAWLMNWLERWPALRQVPDPALAVVGDRDAESPPATAIADVSRFSRQFGLCFIRHDDDLRIFDSVSQSNFANRKENAERRVSICGDAVTIMIDDNGCGLSPHHAPGRGTQAALTFKLNQRHSLT